MGSKEVELLLSDDVLLSSTDNWIEGKKEEADDDEAILVEGEDDGASMDVFFIDGWLVDIPIFKRVGMNWLGVQGSMTCPCTKVYSLWGITSWVDCIAKTKGLDDDNDIKVGSGFVISKSVIHDPLGE